jgi:ribosomal protein L37AE/L43A
VDGRSGWIVFNRDNRDVKRCDECGEPLYVLDEEKAWTLCLACGASLHGPATVIGDDGKEIR